MFRVLLCSLFVAFAAPAFAGSPFTIEDAFVRETPMKVTAGYVILKNPYTQDTLLGADADWAGRIELHSMNTTKDGTMEMKQVKEITVPAKGTLALRPGGYHMMIFDLKKPLKAGDTQNITLHFKNVKTLTVPFKIQPIAYKGTTPDNSVPKTDAQLKGLPGAEDHSAHMHH